MTPYVYVMVREDLPLPQQLVQSNHATLEAGLRFTAPAVSAAVPVADDPLVLPCPEY